MPIECSRVDFCIQRALTCTGDWVGMLLDASLREKLSRCAVSGWTGSRISTCTLLAAQTRSEVHRGPLVADRSPEPLCHVSVTTVHGAVTFGVPVQSGREFRTQYVASSVAVNLCCTTLRKRTARCGGSHRDVSRLPPRSFYCGQ